LTSGIKTYVNFPFAKSDGEVTEKGKRLADSSTGSSIKKDYELDASIDMTVPGGFALDVQLLGEAHQYKYSFESVTTYDDGNEKGARGIIICDFDIPDYSVEYVLL